MLGEISVEELGAWRTEGRDFVLLDVREPGEVHIASLAGSRFIPMREIPGRAAELPKDRTIAVICHGGARSERVAQFLAAQGFGHVVNVDGGIDAYAARVDSSVPRY
jgi:rhodanese-related sulfurtransferase